MTSPACTTGTGWWPRAAAPGIHDKLVALPQGYDTLLTRMFTSSTDEGNPETGVVVSGGQWQRLALARALIRDEPDLMILDEPSAGLDAEAEAQIRYDRRGCGPAEFMMRRTFLGAAVLATTCLAAAALARRLRRRYVLVTVRGESMEPTFRHGDRVLADRTRIGGIRVGDVVVLEPGRPRPVLADRNSRPPTAEPAFWMIKAGCGGARRYGAARIRAGETCRTRCRRPAGEARRHR